MPGPVRVSYNDPSRIVALVAGVLSLFLGAIVLFGWYSHNILLIQVSPAFVPMQFNTALGFCLSGFAVVAFFFHKHQVTMVFGGLVGVIGALALIQYMSGMNLGIDELFMEHYITLKTSNPGRMAPNTALCFVLVGAALVVVGRAPNAFLNNFAGGIIGTLVLALGTVAYTGYFFHLEAAYGWGHMTSMAVHTAVAFMVIGGGLMAASWTREGAARHLFPRWFSGALVIGVITATIALQQAMNFSLEEGAGVSVQIRDLAQYLILAFGVLLGAALGLSAYLTQDAHVRMRLVQESKQDYQRLLISVAEGIYGLDSQGHCTFCNPACLKMLGYEREEDLLGLSLHNIIHHTHADGTPYPEEGCHIIVAFQEGESVHNDTEVFWRKDGTSFPVEYWSYPLWKDTELVGAVVTFIDITERREAEKMVVQAKEEAERADKAKSEFLASMSHELRTPLNAILGFAQMMQLDPRHPLTPSQNEHIECILSGGNHLLLLVNDILDLARIDANQNPLYLKNTDVNAIVAECVSFTTSLGTPRDIRIIDQIADGLPVRLRTDPIRFKQIVLNLLSNAIKFNKEGGTVTIAGRETSDGFYHLSIADTGVGISEDNFYRVFKMFNRFGEDAMVAQDGTGIGLTVTKKLVEQLSGQIGFESKKDHGTTFWIELPLASNEEVLIWANNLQIGVDAIDEDHHQLVILANKIFHESSNMQSLNDATQELIDYTLYHFRREEAVMEACGYPDLENHRRLHQELASQVSEIVGGWYAKQNPEVLHHLRRFLRKWLSGHILKEDAQIAQYTEGKAKAIAQALRNL
ncbi:bacteriohemerythrin, partial [Magnetovibrio blakemorei]|uniref:bacteriohemerythrin n=1 Tax=Magnetovibrio blakemorei TaxID=28181 RepID=UPI000AE013B0